jgi:serine protease Do
MRALVFACVILLLSYDTHAEIPESFADLAEKLIPSVVNISTSKTIKIAPNNPLQFQFRGLPKEFEDLFEQFNRGFGGRGGERQQRSLGSGFVIDASGYVITNNHVIAQADTIKVILSDDSEYEANIVGTDEKTDLALLKIDADKPLQAVKFGDSDASRVGDWVIAIGNPFGLGGSVSAGIISARSRSINSGPFDDFIQTDAAINRGNSGGPLFNTNGEVIGINTAIFSTTGGNIGIGFAVPSALAEPIIRQLRELGRTRRGWLGVRIQEVTDEIAESVGLSEAKGALVLEVEEDSPASKAGIKAGDVILRFDGKAIPEMRRLPRLVAETTVGKRVKVNVWRDEKVKTVTLKLGELEAFEASQKENDDVKMPKTDGKTHDLLGMTLTSITPVLRNQLKLKPSLSGAVVAKTKQGGTASSRGIRRGDVIIRVNDINVDSPAAFKAALESAKKSGRKFALVRLVRKSNTVLFITLPTDTR